MSLLDNVENKDVLSDVEEEANGSKEFPIPLKEDMDKGSQILEGYFQFRPIFNQITVHHFFHLVKGQTKSK